MKDCIKAIVNWPENWMIHALSPNVCNVVISKAKKLSIAEWKGFELFKDYFLKPIIGEKLLSCL